MKAQEIFSVLLGQDPIALIKLHFWHYKNLYCLGLGAMKCHINCYERHKQPLTSEIVFINFNS